MTNMQPNINHLSDSKQLLYTQVSRQLAKMPREKLISTSLYMLYQLLTQRQNVEDLSKQAWHSFLSNTQPTPSTLHQLSARPRPKPKYDYELLKTAAQRQFLSNPTPPELLKYIQAYHNQNPTHAFHTYRVSICTVPEDPSPAFKVLCDLYINDRLEESPVVLPGTWLVSSKYLPEPL